MTVAVDSLLGLLLLVCLAAILYSADGMAQAPIVHPGAPGDPARELSADEAIEIASTSHSPTDAQFVQDMIPHHHQAIEMAALVADRTNRPELTDVAGRINASQGDEIEFMQQWLQERGEPVPEPTEHEAMHSDHKMAGKKAVTLLYAASSRAGHRHRRLSYRFGRRHRCWHNETVR